jgi:hypothetical protein
VGGRRGNIADLEGRIPFSEPDRACREARSHRYWFVRQPPRKAAPVVELPSKPMHVSVDLPPSTPQVSGAVTYRFRPATARLNETSGKSRPRLGWLSAEHRPAPARAQLTICAHFSVGRLVHP